MTRSEAILEARRMYKAGEFDRQVIKRIPKDMMADDVELECGHTEVGLGDPILQKPRHSCSECCDQWIEEHTDAK